MISETDMDQENDPSIDIAISNQRFMLGLYQIMARERQLLFSPFSIYFQLVLMYLGAVEETSEEMKQYLFLPETRDRLLSGLRKLLQDFKQSPVNTAMEMFIQHSYKLRAKFRGDAMKFLHCNLRQVDFVAADETTRLINTWVSSQTKNKIRNIIPAGSLNENFEFVIISAICFEDCWLNQFDEERTCKEKFFTSKTVFTEVDMMHLSGQFHYVYKDTFRALSLPCKDENLKMIIFLPNDVSGLTNLEQNLLEMNIMSVFEDAKLEEVNVTLPKFKWEQRNHKLHSQIRKMGLKIIFDPKRANFTEIHKLGQELICVDFIKHKVVIDVNERGTEVIVQVNGLERKPLGSGIGKKREADAEVSGTEMEKVAKVSEENIENNTPGSEEEEIKIDEKVSEDESKEIPEAGANKVEEVAQAVEVAGEERSGVLEPMAEKVETVLEFCTDETKDFSKVSQEEVEAVVESVVETKSVPGFCAEKTIDSAGWGLVKVNATPKFGDATITEVVVQEMEAVTVSVGQEMDTEFGPSVEGAEAVLQSATGEIGVVGDTDKLDRVTKVCELRTTEPEIGSEVKNVKLVTDSEESLIEKNIEVSEDKTLSVPNFGEEEVVLIVESKEAMNKSTTTYEKTAAIHESVASEEMIGNEEEMIIDVEFKSLETGADVEMSSENMEVIPDAVARTETVSKSMDGEEKGVRVPKLPQEERETIVIEAALNQDTLEFANSSVKDDETNREQEDVSETVDTIVGSCSNEVHLAAGVHEKMESVPDFYPQETEIVPTCNKEETEEIAQPKVENAGDVELNKEEDMVIDDSEKTASFDTGGVTVSWEDSLDSPDDAVKNFTANHPFVFCILYGCTTLVIGRHLCNAE